MPIATVTSKGQITIPIEVRESMRIHSGTRVQFFRRPDGVYEFLPITASVMDLAGTFPWDGPPVSLDEIDRAIGEAAAESMNL
jgi:AbrB family looped-hinge helix DNA binding protein